MPNFLYRKVLQDRQDLFNQALRDGVYTPFIYPWDTFPAFCLLVGVVLTPRLPRPLDRAARYVLTLLSFSYMIARWPYVRTVGLTAGYGIGLAGFWGIIMTVVLLLLHDPGRDFRRIEVRKLDQAQESTSDNHKGVSSALQNGTVRSRSAQANGDVTEEAVLQQTDKQNLQREIFVWQGQPKEIMHLMDWSVDLVTSFRGINWNFRIPIKTYDVPPPQGDPPTMSREAQRLNTGSLERLQRSAIRNFLFYYVLIDLLKTFMMTDPYWLGIASLDSPTPWPWLARLNQIIPVATRFVRLSISLTSVVSALTIIFSLNPLFFATVLPYVLGDKIYSITKSPLYEVWMYPPQWGNMLENLCNKGLAGMWSTWWHQMFRYGISEPSRILIDKLKIDQRSPLSRVLQLSIAFGLTAAIHAAASSTTFSVFPGKPLNPFIFFTGQAVGIIVQTEISKRLNRLAKFPRWLRQACNFGYSFMFMWYIGPYLTDDFARCQIWLFEPVPVSFFRGLGFGPGDCWLPWIQFSEGGKWLGWWHGKNWYDSGVALF